jgi:hypothetical protein
MLSVGETEFSATTHRLKIQAFRLPCSVRILSRWIVATRQSQLNLAHARLSYSLQGSSHAWKVLFKGPLFLVAYHLDYPLNIKRYRGPLNIFLTGNKKPFFRSSLLMKSVKYEIVPHALSPFFSFAVTL